MQPNSYESYGGANAPEDPSIKSMVEQVRETYLKSGASTAWTQLSAMGHAVHSSSPAETARYQNVLGELQREGILPRIAEAARDQLAQGQQPVVGHVVPHTAITPAANPAANKELPAASKALPAPVQERAPIVPPHPVSSQQDNVGGADKQVIQDYVKVSLRAQTGQLDDKGREWLDSAWKYLQKTESTQELDRTKSYIESQLQHQTQVRTEIPKPTANHNEVGPSYGIEPGVSTYQEIRDQIMQGLKLAGISDPTDAQGLAIYNIGYRESRWRAHPPNEGTSKGQMQMELSTFENNYVPGHHDIRSIPDSVAAATRYIAHRYGDDTPGSGLIHIGSRHAPY